MHIYQKFRELPKIFLSCKLTILNFINYLPTILDINYFVYFFNERIHDLENIVHSLEVSKQLNHTGIDIYLYEPLCSYNQMGEKYYPPMGNKMSMQFYSEFNSDMIDSLTLQSQTDDINSAVIALEEQSLLQGFQENLL